MGVTLKPLRMEGIQSFLIILPVANLNQIPFTSKQNLNILLIFYDRNQTGHRELRRERQSPSPQ